MCLLITDRRKPARARWARRLTRGLTALALAVGLTQLGFEPAAAGGGPERAVLIIDPTDADALALGQAYARLRELPANRVLYMRPWAQSFEALVAFQGRALEAELAARGIADAVDYVLIAPGRDFYVPIPVGTVATGCQKVSRLSISSAYGFLPLADEILAGGMSDQASNHYYGARFSDPERELAFDADTSWFNGRPMERPGARRYRIGFLLGYTGPRGNSPEEILAMMERSLAADFTRPEGRFYFMNTSDEIRTRDRRRLWPYTVESIGRLGGQAEVLDGTLPEGRQDALGILTGVTDPRVAQADLGILPGAFADHLTSFAGMFDIGSQGKMSQWITAGASGTAGTVEEPCTGGKFPDPDLHARYLAGMSLGEALWRSTPWTAFQTLFYGDPLTRPFAVPPSVSLPGLPEGPLHGRYLLTAEAKAARAEVEIDRIEVLVDGRPVARTRPGALFELDTRGLADGWHDLRLVAFEATGIRTQGRWLSEIEVDNRGRRVELRALGPSRGGTDFALSAIGGPAIELRLLQDERVVAAGRGARITITLSAERLGAGPVRLQAEALFADGRSARSRPLTLDELASGAPEAEPIAFSHTRYLAPGSERLIELPFAASAAMDVLVLDAPEQAELRERDGAWLLIVPESARGRDRIEFVVRAPAEEPAVPLDGPVQVGGSRSTVEIVYCEPDARDDTSLRLCPNGDRIWLPSLSRGEPGP